MPESFTIPSFKAPGLPPVDVVVVGGGPAGVAAAVAAGRQGLRTLLIEKYGFCGGATVAGLSGTICGLHSSGADVHQIVFGFAEEFRAALDSIGGIGAPVRFGKTALLPHDSLSWKITADRLLADAGVRLLFHAYFLEAFTVDDGRIEALLVRLLEGYRVIRPKAVIDASGDALVIHSIGGKTTAGDNGVVQTPTMIFRLGGVDMPAFLQIEPETICLAVEDADRSGKYRLPRHHVYLFPMPHGHEVLCNMTRITFPDGRVPSGVDSSDMSFAEIEGRAQATEYARFLKERFPAFRDSYIVETGTQVGIRQTRSITGVARLTNEDVLRARKVPGAATFSAWPIEAHGAGQLKITYLNDDHYDIPFETLIPVAGSNVLVAGRCMSAEHEALASARVTAQCLGMGYAAGAAAGLMIEERLRSQQVTGERVADWMKAHRLKSAHER